LRYAQFIRKFAKEYREVHRLIQDMRTKPVEVVIKKLNQIFVGYYY